MTFGQMRVSLKKLREDSMALASILQESEAIAASGGHSKYAASAILEAADLLEGIQKQLPPLGDAAAMLMEGEAENWTEALQSARS